MPWRLYDSSGTLLPMPSFIDKHYRTIRRFRPLYGWYIDARRKAECADRVAKWETKGFRGAKLDICGGRNPYKPGEFLNVDIEKFPKVDIAFDITKTFPFDDSVIAEIFSAATLEHLRKPHVHHVLHEFHRILQSGGILQVSTPDIEAIAQMIVEGGDLDVINQHLFGKYKSDQTEDLDLHKWMYPASTMMKVLEEIGFTNVEQIPMDPALHDPKLNYLVRAQKS